MPPETTASDRFESRLRRNVSMAPMTTLGIGGPAGYFAEIEGEEDLTAAVAWARAGRINLFVLGGGSNVLFSDAGFDGLVIRLRIAGIEIQPKDGFAIVSAGAGEDWDPIVSRCVEAGLAGVECLSGIPGKVGATPIQNVGAYGQEVSETIVSVDAFDLKENRQVTFLSGQCGFAYRSSRFKTTDLNRFVITRVTFRLEPGGAPAVRYPELKRLIERQGVASPGLADVRRAVLEIRRRKAMVIDPTDPDSRSVGSFFVNPIVTAELAEQIRQRHGPEAPLFPHSTGMVKVSAAWLIERSGFSRGLVLGNTGLSSKHALAIINRGGATAAEVMRLSRMIMDGVYETFGIKLAPEPVLAGF